MTLPHALRRHLLGETQLGSEGSGVALLGSLLRLGGVLSRGMASGEVLAMR